MPADADVVLRLVRSIGAPGPAVAIVLDTPLEGVIDSLDLVKLVYLLEDEYRINFRPEDLDREQWRTAASIVELVNRRIAEAGA